MKVVLKKSVSKRTYVLGGVLVLGIVYLLWTNFVSPGDNPASPSSRPNSNTASVSPSQDTMVPQAVTPARSAAGRGEFRVVLHSKRPGESIDVTKVDPTLRLDLLAKVQNVSLEGGGRNLFQFQTAPTAAPLGPLPNVGKVAINKPPVTPVMPPMAPGPPPLPPPPAITLKYYGYTNARGETRKKAFFLDGEDIVMAWEGETIKNRYRVVHVGVNSVEVEDTQYKNKQTLPLADEAVAG